MLTITGHMEKYHSNNTKLISFNFYSIMMLFIAQMIPHIVQKENVLIAKIMKYFIWILEVVELALMRRYLTISVIFAKLILIKHVQEIKFITLNKKNVNVLQDYFIMMDKTALVALFLSFGIQKLKSANLVKKEITTL
jgi:hypothetical protein